MRAGELNEIVVIHRVVNTSDAYGQQITTYAKFKTIRARVMPKGDVFSTSINERLYLNSIVISCRHHTDIYSSDRLEYRGKMYSIQSIIRDRMKQTNEIVAEEIND